MILDNFCNWFHDIVDFRRGNQDSFPFTKLFCIDINGLLLDILTRAYPKIAIQQKVAVIKLSTPGDAFQNTL